MLEQVNYKDTALTVLKFYDICHLCQMAEGRIAHVFN